MRTIMQIRNVRRASQAALVLVLSACNVLLGQTPSADLSTVRPPKERFRKDYIVLPGDQLDIVVRRVPEATRSVMVRADGNITLPLVNDVNVAGLSTHEVDVKLTALLEKRLIHPEVTVIAAQVRQPTVYIGGEVNLPGAVPLRNAATAVQALSFAGGLRKAASASKISIIRLGPEGELESFPLKVVGHGQRAPYEALARVALLPDDIIFVPESGRSQLNRFIDDFINHPLQGANAVIGTYVNYKLIRIIDKSLP